MKPEIVQVGLSLGLAYENTWSCDNGNEVQCGECGACWLRQKAFLDLGMEDLAQFQKKLVAEEVKVNRKQKSIEDLFARLNVG